MSYLADSECVIFKRFLSFIVRRMFYHDGNAVFGHASLHAAPMDGRIVRQRT